MSSKNRLLNVDNRLLTETNRLLRKCNKNNRTSCKVTLPIAWLNKKVIVQLSQDKEQPMPVISIGQQDKVSKSEPVAVIKQPIVEKTICSYYNNGICKLVMSCNPCFGKEELCRIGKYKSLSVK